MFKAGVFEFDKVGDCKVIIVGENIERKIIEKIMEAKPMVWRVGKSLDEKHAIEIAANNFAYNHLSVDDFFYRLGFGYTNKNKKRRAYK